MEIITVDADKEGASGGKPRSFEYMVQINDEQSLSVTIDDAGISIYLFASSNIDEDIYVEETVGGIVRTYEEWARIIQDGL